MVNVGKAVHNRIQAPAYLIKQYRQDRALLLGDAAAPAGAGAGTGAMEVDDAADDEGGEGVEEEEDIKEEPGGGGSGVVTGNALRQKRNLVRGPAVISFPALAELAQRAWAG